jgi:hypothetical protein
LQTYPVLQDSYEHFGCHTSNVRFMLISTNHTQAQMLIPPYTNYDYFKIPNPPGGSINSTYIIGAYPTVIIIKPNRAIAEQDIWPINNSILRSKIIQHGGIPQDCSGTSFTLTLNAVPEEGGEVTGAGEYEVGEMVEVNATANEGWEFMNWTNDLGMIVSADALYSFIMPDDDLTLNANFGMIDYELLLTVTPEASGEVTGAGIYNFGDQVEVNATPATGWGFVNWTDEDGEEVSATAFYSFSMPANDLSLIANFEPVSGIDQLTSVNLFVVYPNPTSGLVYVNAKDELLGAQYLIYNHIGENVATGKIHSGNTVIDLANLPAGVYFITVADNPGQSLKILKR